MKHVMLWAMLSLAAVASSQEMNSGAVDSSAIKVMIPPATPDGNAAPGNLAVTVLNAENWGTASTYGWVDLFNVSNQLVSTVQTNSSSVASFQNLAPGQYWYRVRYNLIPTKVFGEEYWGVVPSVSVVSGSTTNETFVRGFPYLPSIRVFNAQTNQELSGPVNLGTTLRVDVLLKNPNQRSSWAYPARSRLILDRDRALPYDYADSSSTAQMNIGTERLTSFVFTPTYPGTYRYVAGAAFYPYSYPTTSDGSDWTILFSVVADPPPAPTLASPADNATGIVTNPLVTWNAAANATSYRLQLSDDSTFTRVVVDQSSIPVTSYHVNGLSLGVRYYWRVNASNSYGISPWSTVRAFTTDNPNGSLAITASNAEDWGLAGRWSWVDLYNSSNALIGTVKTDTFSVALFQNVPAGTGYWYQVRTLYLPIKLNGEEYWGKKSGVAVVGSQVTAESFKRNAPYAPWIAVFYASSGEPVTGPVTLGTPLRIDLTVKNPSDPGAETQLTKARLYLDRDMTAPYDFRDSTAFQSYTPGASNIISFYYTPQDTGRHRYCEAVLVSRSGVPTVSDGSDWTTLFRAIPAPPPAPTLLSPADGTTGVSTSPTLTWNAAARATSYHIQISHRQQFDTLAVDETGIVSPSYAAAGLGSATKYYWRVCATGDGGTGDWSSVWSFTTESLTGTLAVSVENAEAWGPVGTWAWIDLYDSGNQLLKQEQTNASSTAIFKDVPGTSGYWYRVRYGKDIVAPYGEAYWGERTGVAVAKGGITNEAFKRNAPYIFTSTVYNAGTNQEVVGPVPAGTTLRIAFTVKNPSNIGSKTQLVRARLLVDRDMLPPFEHADSSGLQSMNAGTVAEFSFTVTPSIPGVYHLFGGLACILDASTVTCDRWWWDTLATVTVPPPEVPVLASPTNGTTGIGLSPLLSWNPASGADAYRLQVSHRIVFDSLTIDQAGIASTSITAGGLKEGTTYYWRVNASNAGGNSAWSTVWSFTTLLGLPAAPVLVSPANGTTGAPVSLVLSWSSVASALSYHLQMARDAGMTTTELDDSTLVSTSLAMTNLPKGVTFYWRVRAKNVTGSGAWSGIWNFSTVVPLPSAVTLSTPLHNALVSADSIRLVWLKADPQVTAYRLDVATDSAFAFRITDTSVTDTFKLVRSLFNGQQYYWRVAAKNASGWGSFSEVRNFRVVLTAIATSGELPRELSLGQNYPNPFNPSTHIEFALPKEGHARLEVYNMLGQNVRTILDNVMTAGRHIATFDAGQLPNGVYLYRLTAGGSSLVGKMILAK